MWSTVIAGEGCACGPLAALLRDFGSGVALGLTDENEQGLRELSQQLTSHQENPGPRSTLSIAHSPCHMLFDNRECVCDMSVDNAARHAQAQIHALSRWAR
ncbi:hypothetical protein AAFF_G00263050 [Aldrovandia affinis]|uniref:Uncharacterized protein n=1 Tax=Aldrovandia affinis TaxID=143900 RepID=A0AAD7SSK5_9TELE|nr:hypothetical protein AAFF_G00263050 [Aldrovandia affinis]